LKLQNMFAAKSQ